MVFVASLLCFCPEAKAQNDGCDSVPKRRGLFKRMGHSLYEFVKEFSRVDTAYIEPQHYNYTVMLQNTNTYEVYRLTTEHGTSVTSITSSTIASFLIRQPSAKAPCRSEAADRRCWE